MTTATVGSELTIVYIVGQVTIGTAITGFSHRLERTPVTAFTSDLDVRAVQFKLSLYVVIKQPQVPGDRVVTRFAVALKDTFVIVVVPVAVDAGTGSVRELLRLVTILTANIRVLAKQRKCRQVVIEKRRVCPPGFGMTTGALFTKLPFVRIILQVTGHAVGAG